MKQIGYSDRESYVFEVEVSAEIKAEVTILYINNILSDVYIDNLDGTLGVLEKYKLYSDVYKKLKQLEKKYESS